MDKRKMTKPGLLILILGITPAIAQTGSETAQFASNSFEFLDLVGGFFLGLAGKLLYDIISERRKKLEVRFVKTVQANFDIQAVHEKVRDALSVSYASQTINSVIRARVEIENKSSRPVLRQIANVRFSDDAIIISDEDVAGPTAECEEVVVEKTKNNARTLKIGALRRDCSVTLDFTVINHEGDFEVEPGFWKNNDGNVDAESLTVKQIVVSTQAEPDIYSRIIKFFTILAFVAIFREVASITGDLELLGLPVLIFFYVYLLREGRACVGPLMDWFKNVLQRSETNPVYISGGEVRTESCTTGAAKTALIRESVYQGFNVAGEWRTENPELKQTVKLELYQKANTIHGEATVENTASEGETLNVSREKIRKYIVSGIIVGKTVQINLRIDRKDRLGLVSLLLELIRDGRSMEGWTVYYATDKSKICSCQETFTRKEFITTFRTDKNTPTEPVEANQDSTK